VKLDKYCKVLNIEALTMLDMLWKDILPAVSAFTGEISESANRKRALCAQMDVSYETELAKTMSALISEDTVNYLELACDICKHFISDSTAPILYKIFELGKNNISFYAVETLITAKKSVPNEVIYALAGDIEYAELTYSVLKSHKLLHLFPAEFSNEEYLAKSNLTRWLLYPTELGKLPDKIEYLGKVKKKEVFHILRFTSDSDNLEDALKGKWLIGWASEDGGTFSNFDLYENFEQKTLDKTLKFIKKKLL